MYLRSAIHIFADDTKHLNSILEHSTEVRGCLFTAINKIPHNKDFIEKLFLKTTDFEHCLYSAIRKEMDFDFLKRLLKKTPDPKWCLLAAIITLPYDKEFFDELIEKTTDFDGCIDEAKNFMPEVYNKLCLIQ